MAYTQQQQNEYINKQAQDAKDEIDRLATIDRKKVADAEIARVSKLAEDEVKRLQYEANK